MLDAVRGSQQNGRCRRVLDEGSVHPQHRALYTRDRDCAPAAATDLSQCADALRWRVFARRARAGRQGGRGDRRCHLVWARTTVRVLPHRSRGALPVRRPFGRSRWLADRRPG